MVMSMTGIDAFAAMKVRRYLKKNPDVVLLYLPVARPELSAMEAVEGCQVRAGHVGLL